MIFQYSTCGHSYDSTLTEHRHRKTYLTGNILKFHSHLRQTKEGLSVQLTSVDLVIMYDRTTIPANRFVEYFDRLNRNRTAQQHVDVVP